MIMPGPGDPETWGSTTSHPNDPRNGDPGYRNCDECAEETVDLEFYDRTGLCKPCFKELFEADLEEESEAMAVDAHLEMQYEDRYESE